MKFPGKILLLGSGETSTIGGHVFETLVQTMPSSPIISILETPAGFELNSEKVADKVGCFLHTRLQNYQPKIHLIPARKKGTKFSPDNIEVLQPILKSNILYMGAGSPTYAIRQLEGSLAWDLLRAKHFLGSTIILASAAIIAAGKLSLPVYEIFKVGEDPHWVKGLDFLAPFGLSLVFVPHWNNKEGGCDLDTSRCYLGQERFLPLIDELPEEVNVIGLDELTALLIDFSSETCEVLGRDSIHIMDRTGEKHYSSGTKFSICELGNYLPLTEKPVGISIQAWSEIDVSSASSENRIIPDEIEKLVSERQSARESKDWKRADDMRKKIEDSGWQVKDTPAGPLIEFAEVD
jgi:hypothetical protein